MGLIIEPVHHNTKPVDKKALSGQGNVNLIDRITLLG
jgi:hypothetical protein